MREVRNEAKKLEKAKRENQKLKMTDRGEEPPREELRLGIAKTKW